MNTTTDTRRSDLAKIHLAAKQLHLDRETYEAMLFSIARVRSAKDLDHAGRRRVLDHLKSRGFKAKTKPGGHHKGVPHNIDSDARGLLLRKIEAQLADASRPWTYADGMAKKMFHVEKLAFCDVEQLRRIIAALSYDAKRRGAKA